MKKIFKNKYFIFTSIIIVLVAYIFYSLPKSYTREVTGVYFKIRDTKGKETKSVSIKFYGYYKKRLFRGDKFKGTMYIDDKRIDGVELDFKNHKFASIFGSTKDSEYTGELEFIGRIYTNGDLKKFTINIHKKTEGGYSWSSKDGYIISGPCNTREEALEIYNELFSEKIKKLPNWVISKGCCVV